MTAIMYDGINSLAAAIHLDFPDTAYVAGYVNGDFAWTTAQWNLFPHATKVQISVTASADEGDVLDVETGDATPAQTEGWIRLRKASGYYRPTIYCNLETVPAVRTGTGPYVLGTDYDLWVAAYDGSTASVYSGSSAKQYMSTASYDVSAVYDNGWPHRAEPVTTPPAPASVSATPWLLIDMSWSVVEVNGAPSPHYRYQIAEGTPEKPGTIVASDTVTSVHATATVKPGTYCWRVQGAGNAAFSPWKAV